MCCSSCCRSCCCNNNKRQRRCGCYQQNTCGQHYNSNYHHPCYQNQNYSNFSPFSYNAYAPSSFLTSPTPPLSNFAGSSYFPPSFSNFSMPTFAPAPKFSSPLIPSQHQSPFKPILLRPTAQQTMSPRLKSNGGCL